jgi:hypothetical protein
MSQREKLKRDENNLLPHFQKRGSRRKKLEGRQ